MQRPNGAATACPAIASATADDGAVIKFSIIFKETNFSEIEVQHFKKAFGSVDSSAVHAESKSKIIKCKLLSSEPPVPTAAYKSGVFRTRMCGTFSHSGRMLALSSCVCVRKLPA
ncbi:MAG: hypothetical protein ACYC54_04980 [Sedimentisphaerales bacterium]